jgi:hypothetical protein
MPDDELERLISDFAALGRKIYAMGQEAERTRIMAALQSSDAPTITPLPARAPRKPRMRSRKSYGSVSVPVTAALTELSADSPSGVTVADLEAHFELHGGGPTGKQIRAALKQLTKSGKTVNVSRGKYLSPSASKSRGAEKPGDDAPGSLSLAAE